MNRRWNNWLQYNPKAAYKDRIGTARNSMAQAAKSLAMRRNRKKLQKCRENSGMHHNLNRPFQKVRSMQLIGWLRCLIFKLVRRTTQKPLHNVASEAEARKKMGKNRNVHSVHEDFEPFFNAASASAVVVKRFFSGDVRSRHHAHAHVPILPRWPGARPSRCS